MTISDEQLVAYATGELPVEDTALVERHLAEYPDKHAFVNRIRDAVFTMRTDDSVAPSPAAVQRTLEAMRDERRAAWTEWIDRAKRFVSELVFDSRMQIAVAGHRGAAEGYQLGYESDAARIDLSVTPAGTTPRRWRVRGRVTAHGDDAPGAVVLRLRGTREAVASAAVDEGGRFVIDPEPGVYDLIVRMGETAAVAGGVEVG
jgi:anti-sigma factor RsiW